MARIVTPQNERSRSTRAGLLDAAWTLLESPDGATVTMAGVADACGVSRQAVYLHFESRGQLFMALLDHIDDALDLQASLRPMLEAPDALTSLDAFCEHVARFHSELVGVVRAIDRIRRRDDDAAELWQRFKGIWYDAATKIAVRLDDEGHLAAPWTVATAADLMWALMSTEFVDDLTYERGWTVDELGDRLSVLTRRTICAVPT